MKTLRILMLALLIPAFVMTGCTTGGDNPGDAQIVLPNDNEKTQQAFADDETTGGFTFTAKSAWTATVTESGSTRVNLSGGSATRADGAKWLRLLFDGRETYEGGAGKFTLVIELDENYTGKTRTATITIKSGNDTITVTVTQDGKTKEGTVPVDVLTKIPDAEFRAYCAENMAYWDTDHDGILSIEEAAAVRFIDFQFSGAISLEGIEYFTGLIELNCGGNPLTSLDVSKNTALIILACVENQLTSLDVSENTALIVLHCGSNRLTSLDVSKNTALTNLICFSNPGNGTSFPITVWFDESSPIPTGFPSEGWFGDMLPIEVEYIYL